MKIVFTEDLVDHVERINKEYGVSHVLVSESDMREVHRRFISAHGESDSYIDEDNHCDVGYPGCSDDVTLNGINYQISHGEQDYN